MSDEPGEGVAVLAAGREEDDEWEDGKDEHLGEDVHQLAPAAHLRPKDVVAGRVLPLQPVTLAPLLVQQLLELFVRHKLLVPVQDGNVEVGVSVTAVRTGLQQRLHLVLGRTPEIL